jgi:hypothetical protein
MRVAEGQYHFRALAYGLLFVTPAWQMIPRRWNGSAIWEPAITS